MNKDMFYFEYKEAKGYKTNTKIFYNEMKKAYKSKKTEKVMELIADEIEKECREPVQVPVKTVYMREFENPKSENEKYARSVVSCSHLDFSPKRKVGRFLAKCYLEKQMINEEAGAKIESFLADKKSMYCLRIEGGTDPKRVFKDEENGPEKIDALNAEIKDIISQYSNEFYAQAADLAEKMGITYNQVVKNFIANETQIKPGVDDRHVEYFGEECLTEYEWNVFEKLKNQAKKN